MNRDSVIFYKSFYEAIKELSIEQQGIVYNAIFKYQFENAESELNGIEKAVFTLIKPQIDANNVRYENGCKGGAPKGNQNAKKRPKNNQEITKQQPNENEKVNVKDDSCVDGLVAFYEQNIGTLSPYVYSILEDYRKELPDNVIKYALELAVESGAKNIKYVKAILNNWTENNIKTLIDAKNENAKRKSINQQNKPNNIFVDNTSQYDNLDKFYVN